MIKCNTYQYRYQYNGICLKENEPCPDKYPLIIDSQEKKQCVSSCIGTGYDYYFNKPYFKVYHDKESFEKGLNELIGYINDTPNYKYIINQDYNFSFSISIKSIYISLNSQTKYKK